MNQMQMQNQEKDTTNMAMHPTNDHPQWPPPYQYGHPAPQPSAPVSNQHFPIQNYSMHPHGKTLWSTGLCDCCYDVPNCIITSCCPCVTFGQIAEIIDGGSIPCLAHGILYTVICWATGLACIYSCFYRSRMRDQYMLAETPYPDWCLHLFCEPCALCQEYRELKNRGFNMYLGYHKSMEKMHNEAMQRQMQMQMPSPPQVEEEMKR